MSAFPTILINYKKCALVNRDPNISIDHETRHFYVFNNVYVPTHKKCTEPIENYFYCTLSACLKGKALAEYGYAQDRKNLRKWDHDTEYKTPGKVQAQPFIDYGLLPTEYTKPCTVSKK
jgi:hypothetical protein